MPGETQAFWMLSSDYKVLRSTVIALSNFIQYSHCEVVQSFLLTPFLTKAFTTIVFKHIVYPCVRYSDKGSCLKFIKIRATLFLSVFVERNFSLTANVEHTVEQRLKSHTAHGLALIHSTCSSN